MSDEIIFSEMTDDELEECYQLCMSCFHEETDWSEVRKAWAECCGDSHYSFVVGKLNGKIAAFTAMNFVHTLFDGSHPLCILWFVCVDECLRRKGIGRRLFAEIERIAAEKNCEFVYLTCVKSNLSAIEFYKSLGYYESGDIALEKRIKLL